MQGRWTKRAITVATLLGTWVLGASAEAQTFRYTTTAEFAGGTSTTVVSRTAGQLELGDAPIRRGNVVWSDNVNPGYIIRFDATTGRQIGRYDTVLLSTPGLPATVLPRTSAFPGRIALDQNADAWVINRAFGSQGSVTHVSSLASRCVDRNGNGRIDTSSDVNGDGLISVVPADGEYFAQNDECLLSTTAVGANNSFPRGIAFDRLGKMWTSSHEDGRAMRWNVSSGVPVLEMTFPVGGRPYSMATGGDWVYISSSSSGGASRINILTDEIQTLPSCPGTYGIVAGVANEAWMGGYFSGTQIYRADWTARTCTAIPAASQVTAMTRDPAGNIWAAVYGNGTVSKYSPAGVLLGNYPAGGNAPHGLSVDSNGILWVVTHSGRMGRINITTGALIDTPTLGGPGVSDPDPYLYSDYTGWQLAVDAPFANLGTWVVRADGGGPSIPWARLAWNAEGGAVPAGTTITARVRAANTLAGLATAAYVDVTSGAAIAGVVGQFAEIEMTLRGPGTSTPVLTDVTLTGPCSGALGEACCVSATQCNDGNVCTTDTCAVAGGTCGHTSVPSCCNAVADCADTNACTTETCVANRCGSMPTPSGTVCPDGFCNGAAMPMCVECTTGTQCGQAGVCVGNACVGFDHDGDGVLDDDDVDSDNDGIPDVNESTTAGLDGSLDTDSDGTPDYRDSDTADFVDTNGDGTDDRLDPDSDGVPSFIDLDSDNDGIPDLLENGGLALDLNRDGLPDAFADMDADGLGAAFDTNDSDPSIITTLGAILDLDMTGGPNFLDLDADGDGLFDIAEGGGVDANADGRVAVTTDTNNNGYDDAVDPGATGTALLLPDNDMDMNRDWLDVDDDNDGILTRFEAADANANGLPEDARNSDSASGDTRPDYLDVDDDGDGVWTEFEAPDANDDGNPADARNTDAMAMAGDMLPDYLDVDDDADGFPTSEEAPDADADGDPADARNTDMDTLADFLDLDDDGDGLDTPVEVADGRALTPPADDLGGRDEDTTVHWLDTDSDGDGVVDRAEGRDDIDMDGIPNYLDADSAPLDTDMDGLRDDIECPGFVTPCPDTDMDGMPDFNDPDDDGDGVPTATELPRGNTDMMDGPDYLDTDDDNDGVLTMEESARDSDGDMVPDSIEPDDDNDGILTRDERPMGADRDTDMNGTPDYRQPDDDNDGILTRDERPMLTDRDTDMDGRPDHLDADDDNDTIPTRDERPMGRDVDTDSDTRPNHLDPDDDNDTIPTAREVVDGRAHGNDVDEDGNNNWLDTDSDADGMTDASECPMSAAECRDANGNDVPDYLEPPVAGVDAGPDAGSPDGGIVGGISGGACGCSTAGTSQGTNGLWLMALAGLAVIARRRRSAR